MESKGRKGENREIVNKEKREQSILGRDRREWWSLRMKENNMKGSKYERRIGKGEG